MGGARALEQAGVGAAVDLEGRAGDEAGLLGAHEGDDAAEVGGIAQDTGGTVAAARAAPSGPPCRESRRSVACEPGSTELTVTPSAATSVARVLRKAVAPARAVLERMRKPMGCFTAMDVMATTRPHRRSRIAGTAAWHMATTDRRFRSRAGP